MNHYHSKKREEIVNLFKDGSLLTAKGVCNLVPNIDRATVYRTIKSLVEQGILREVHLNKDYSHYELTHAGDNHQHFMCTNCEKIIPVEVDSKLIAKLLPKDIKTEEFELNIKGRCNDCK